MYNLPGLAELHCLQRPVTEYVAIQRVQRRDVANSIAGDRTPSAACKRSQVDASSTQTRLAAKVGIGAVVVSHRVHRQLDEDLRVFSKALCTPSESFDC